MASSLLAVSAKPITPDLESIEFLSHILNLDVEERLCQIALIKASRGRG